MAYRRGRVFYFHFSSAYVTIWRMWVGVLFSFLVGAQSVPNSNAPTLYIDCRLTSFPVPCLDLVPLYFSGQLISRADTKSSATIVVTLTEQLYPTGERKVTFGFESRTTDAISVGPFEMSPTLSANVTDALAAQKWLFAYIDQGVLVHFHPRERAIVDPEGVATLSHDVSIPAGGQGIEKTKFSEGPFYVNMSLSGQTYSAGRPASATGFNTRSSSAYGNGKVLLNYSKPRVRVVGDIHAGYAESSYPSGNGGQVEASNFTRGFSAMAIYSVAKRWSVAVIRTSDSNPGSNFTKDQYQSGGVEWTLVPFRANETREVAIRATVGENAKNLLLPNDRGNTSERLAYVYAALRFFWMFDESRAVINARASAFTVLSFSGYESYSASMDLGYQILRPIRITAGVSYGYTRRSLTYPADPDFSNPYQTTFLGGQPGGSLRFSFGMTATIGNRKRQNEDRRWQ